MNKLKVEDIIDYVENHIGDFHYKRVKSLEKLKLKTLLKKKNPYLFKAKYLLTSEAIIRKLTDAFISSNEETIFGDWLEGLAIHICNLVYGGKKSSTKGIDLEFEKDSIRYIVAIKSGPNWGNSSQIAKMKQDFVSAAKTLRTSNSYINVRAVNGCCYGRDNNPDKGEYLKYCGQDFWYFISGNALLYKEILIPLEHKAKEKNTYFIEEYNKMINRFTREFSSDYCDSFGKIDWDKLIEYNSSSNNL